MASLTIRSLALISCFMIITQFSAKGELSEQILDLASVLNGDFVNLDQDKDTPVNNDRMECFYFPVLDSHFLGPLIYGVEYINRKVYRCTILLLSETSDRHINLSYHNFSDPSRFNCEHETFNPDVLYNLKPEDIKSLECPIILKQIFRDLFEGKAADCRHTVDGKHPMYSIAISCGGMRLVAPEISDEKTTSDPYDNKQRGRRFPLKGAPKDYVGPCKDNL